MIAGVYVSVSDQSASFFESTGEYTPQNRTFTNFPAAPSEGLPEYYIGYRFRRDNIESTAQLRVCADLFVRTETSDWVSGPSWCYMRSTSGLTMYTETWLSISIFTSLNVDISEFYFVVNPTIAKSHSSIAENFIINGDANLTSNNVFAAAGVTIHPATGSHSYKYVTEGTTTLTYPSL